MTGKLKMTANFSVVALPTKCPSQSRSITSGSSCATIGSTTASLPLMTTSSAIAAKPGISSLISFGAWSDPRPSSTDE